ncbi:MAG: hypothetical protein CVT72_02765 [Alphaproteobacteria bacterium HGW-Alphaproteobacteria-11]|nr:MAG: hypothetical protein CVT72_02765 [Alphaproteobacteria bacterium HGW-Alphaproteobacteria-11]
MTNEITIERLKEIVDAWGASPSRWPEAERRAAEALLAASSEARGLVAEAQSLDALLDAAPVEAPSAALMARLMAARPRPVASAPSVKSAEPRGRWRALVDAVWPDGSPAVAAGTLAASIMLGVMVGSAADFSPLTGAETVAATTTDDQLIALAMADLDWPEEWMQ